MNIINIIRIAAGVGLSVINLCSAVKHAKEMNGSLGLINQSSSFMPASSSTSYGYNDNTFCDYSSRRYAQPQYIAPQPQYIVPQSQYITPPQPQYIAPPPQPQPQIRPINPFSGYNDNSGISMMSAPQYQTQVQSVSYQTPVPMQNNNYVDTSSRRFCNYNIPCGSYNNSFNNPSITTTFDRNYGYGYADYPSQQNNPWSMCQPPQYYGSYNEPKWMDKSIGQIQAEQALMNYCNSEQQSTGPRKPLFNWKSDRLRWYEEQDKGIVAFHAAPDGSPLYGSL